MPEKGQPDLSQCEEDTYNSLIVADSVKVSHETQMSCDNINF